MSAVTPRISRPPRLMAAMKSFAAQHHAAHRASQRGSVSGHWLVVFMVNDKGAPILTPVK
jgi:hypothetical protein